VAWDRRLDRVDAAALEINDIEAARAIQLHDTSDDHGRAVSNWSYDLVSFT
jgi:hypothetical protein